MTQQKRLVKKKQDLIECAALVASIRGGMCGISYACTRIVRAASWSSKWSGRKSE